MNMAAVRSKAKEVGVKAGKMSKTELVRAIQEKEGNPACFKTSPNGCDQYECLWREDCLEN